MPSLHENITKLLPASARYLSLCLPVQPIPFPYSPRSSLPHHISALSNPSSLPVGCGALYASARDAPKPTLPQLNLHNTRVRRNPSGFLQVAVSKARNPQRSCPHLACASDTALRLLSTYSYQVLVGKNFRGRDAMAICRYYCLSSAIILLINIEASR